MRYRGAALWGIILYLGVVSLIVSEKVANSQVCDLPDTFDECCVCGGNGTTCDFLPQLLQRTFVDPDDDDDTTCSSCVFLDIDYETGLNPTIHAVSLDAIHIRARIFGGSVGNITIQIRTRLGAVYQDLFKFDGLTADPNFAFTISDGGIMHPPTDPIGNDINIVYAPNLVSSIEDVRENNDFTHFGIKIITGESNTILILYEDDASLSVDYTRYPLFDDCGVYVGENRTCVPEPTYHNFISDVANCGSCVQRNMVEDSGIPDMDGIFSWDELWVSGLCRDCLNKTVVFSVRRSDSLAWEPVFNFRFIADPLGDFYFKIADHGANFTINDTMTIDGNYYRPNLISSLGDLSTGIFSHASYRLEFEDPSPPVATQMGFSALNVEPQNVIYYTRNRTNTCEQYDNINACVGCDGVAFSNLEYDECCVCGGDGPGEGTCAEVDPCPAPSFVDNCGVCREPDDPARDSTCAGCDCAANSGTELLSCGLCDQPNREQDCFDVCGVNITGRVQHIGNINGSLPDFGSRVSLSRPWLAVSAPTIETIVIYRLEELPGFGATLFQNITLPPNMLGSNAIRMDVSVGSDTRPPVIIASRPNYVRTEASYNTGVVFVYLYQEGVWSLTQEIFPANEFLGGEFGDSIAVSPNGEWMVASQPMYQDEGLINNGMLHVYKRVANGSFALIQTIPGPATTSGLIFSTLGKRVALGNNILVATGLRGHEYRIYTCNSTSSGFKLEAVVSNGLTNGNNVISSMDIDGDTVVATTIENGGDSDFNIITIQRNSTTGLWPALSVNTDASSYTSEPVVSSQYGKCLKLYKGIMIAGDPLDPSENDPGKAFISTKFGGYTDTQLLPGPGVLGAEVGRVCELDDHIAIYGSRFYTLNGSTTPGGIILREISVDRVDCGGVCAGTNISCSTVCGDGIVEGPEECDDILNPCCDPDTCLFVNASIPCNEDNDACTIDQCDGNGNCVLDSVVDHDDGLACNGLETCDPSDGSIIPGTPVDCPNPDLCTDSNCQEPGGMCVDTPVVCDDGNPCNGNETCDPMSGCVSGMPPVPPPPPTITLDPVNGLTCDAGNNITSELFGFTGLFAATLDNMTCTVLLTPVGASATITDGHFIEFDGDGPYTIECEVATQCADVTTQQLIVNVQDCCGNSANNANEECDQSASDPQHFECCHPNCTYVAANSECDFDGEINTCADVHMCDGVGSCVPQPTGNTPAVYQILNGVANDGNFLFNSVVYTLNCTDDVTDLNVLVLITDEPHDTVGLYNWTVVDVSNPDVARFQVTVGSGSSVVGEVLGAPHPELSLTGGMDAGEEWLLQILIEEPCGVTAVINVTVIRTSCCGNGVVNTGEECDSLLSPLTCSNTTCEITSVCGDGMITGQEICDTFNQDCCVDCFSVHNSSTVCRPQMGTCDVVDFCDGVGADCPADAVQPNSFECRAQMGPCDVPENCDGVTHDCPADGVATNTTLVHPSQGPCENEVYCDGTTKMVPPRDFDPSNTICDPAPGQCFLPGICDGMSPNCSEIVILDGTPCDTDGLACTVEACDMAGVCETTMDNCECIFDSNCTVIDDLCMVGNCTNNTCVTTMLPNYCFIDGSCYVDGAVNPMSDCQVCNVSSGIHDWYNVDAGSPCDTGNPTGLCSAQDTCNGMGMCVDNYEAMGVECRAVGGACDVAETCPGNSDFCPTDSFLNNTVPCGTPPGPEEECLVPTTCSGSSPTCPPPQFFPDTQPCGGSPRGPCEAQRFCNGSFALCGDPIFLGETQVCYISPPANDCENDAFCPPIDVNFNDTGLNPWDCTPPTLRNSSEPCGDGPEGPCEGQRFCSGVSTMCETERIMLGGTQCGPDPGLCGDAPVCDDNATMWWLCPSPIPYPDGTVCRAPTGDCDPQESCDGIAFTCPPDALASNETVCHMPQGSCEQTVFCSGVDSDCGPRVFYDNSFVCRAAVSNCDLEETCPGNNETCPPDAVQPAFTECIAPRGDCHNGAFCDGFGSCLPETWKDSSTRCYNSTGPCELNVNCDGFSDDCPAPIYRNSNFVCNASSNPCVSESTCTGSSPECPPQVEFGNDTLCAPSTGDCVLPGFCQEGGVCANVTYREAGYVCALAPSVCFNDSVCLGEGEPDCPPVQQFPAGTNCSVDGIPCTEEQCNMDGDCVVIDDQCECFNDVDCLGGENATFCISLSCVENMCVGSLLPNTCQIDGECYIDGDFRPGNPCEMCDSSNSQVSWTPTAQGAPCNTGNPTGLCSAPDVCDGMGSCVDVYVANDTVCRSTAGVCDLPEFCPGDSDFCPGNMFASMSTICYMADPMLGCDVNRTCPGNSAQCPPDEAAPSTQVCRPARGPCEDDAFCPGTDPGSDPNAKVCPPNLLLPDGAVCGPTPGACEIQGLCGLGPNFNASAPWLCPENEIRDSNYVCRSAVGPCDAPETCDGENTTCPVDAVQSQGVVCAAARGPCEDPAICDGENITCPAWEQKDNSFICHVPVNGSCGIPTTCDDTHSPAYECPPTEVLPMGTPCGPAPRGPCEVQGECDGTTEPCPPRAFAGPIECRAPISMLCDVAEFCDPMNTPVWECPPDVTVPDDTPCPDADFCNGDELCESGICVPGPPRDCDDGNSCTTDVCFISACLNIPDPPAGNPCYTGPNGTVNRGVCQEGMIVCNGTGPVPQYECVGDVLPSMELCMPPGLDEDCDDLVDEGCFGGACEDDSDCLMHIPSLCQAALCNNNTDMCEFPVLAGFCLINDTCVPDGTPDPSNPCSTCQPLVDLYGYSPDDSQIVDDNNICNGVEDCQGGVLVYTSPPLDCSYLDSDNGCILGSCDSITGCFEEFLPSHTVCSPDDDDDDSGEICRCHVGECVCEDPDGFDGIVFVIVLGGIIIILLLISCCCFFVFGERRRRKHEDKKKTLTVEITHESVLDMSSEERKNGEYIPMVLPGKNSSMKHRNRGYKKY